MNESFCEFSTAMQRRYQAKSHSKAIPVSHSLQVGEAESHPRPACIRKPADLLVLALLDSGGPCSYTWPLSTLLRIQKGALFWMDLVFQSQFIHQIIHATSV